jgi:CheW-like domain
MSDPLASRLAELRASFDQAFAQPPSGTAPDFEDLLSVRVAGEPWFAPVRELAGLSQRLKLVRVPTRAPGFLGLSAQRGRLLPVWSLRALMGYPPGEDGQWLLLPRAAQVALMFEAFEGHLRVPVAGLRELKRPVIDLAAVCQKIEERAQRPAAGE